MSAHNGQFKNVNRNETYVAAFWLETFMILTQESCQPGLGNQISKSRPIIDTIYDYQVHELLNLFSTNTFNRLLYVLLHGSFGQSGNE
jgi:hypothetical protein